MANNVEKSFELSFVNLLMHRTRYPFAEIDKKIPESELKEYLNSKNEECVLKVLTQSTDIFNKEEFDWDRATNSALIARFFPELLDPDFFKWKKSAWAVIAYCPSKLDTEKVSFEDICGMYDSITERNFLKIMDLYGVKTIRSGKIFSGNLSMGDLVKIYVELKDLIDFSSPEIVSAILSKKHSTSMELFYKEIPPVETEELAHKVVDLLKEGMSISSGTRLLSKVVEKEALKSLKERHGETSHPKEILLDYQVDFYNERHMVNSNEVQSLPVTLIEKVNSLYRREMLFSSEVETVSEEYLNQPEGYSNIHYRSANTLKLNRVDPLNLGVRFWKNYSYLVPRFNSGLFDSEKFNWKEDGWSVLKYTPQKYEKERFSFKDVCSFFPGIKTNDFVEMMSYYNVSLITEPSLFKSGFNEETAVRIVNEGLIDLINFQDESMVKRILSLKYIPNLEPIYSKIEPVQSESNAIKVVKLLEKGLSFKNASRLLSNFVSPQFMEKYYNQLGISNQSTRVFNSFFIKNQFTK